MSFISPFSFLLEPSITIDHNQLKKLSLWHNRCFECDFNKDIENRIKTHLSDYIIIDLADARYALCEYRHNDKLNTLTESKLNIAYKEDIINDLKNDGDVTVLIKDPKKIDEVQIHILLDKYCKILTKYYSPKQIILIVPYFSNNYYDEDNILKKFPINNNNEFISYLSEYLGRTLNCHMLYIPKNAIASSKHKWGLDRLHYCDGVYINLLSDIEEIIVNNKNCGNRIRIQPYSGISNICLGLEGVFDYNPPIPLHSPFDSDYMNNVMEMLSRSDAQLLLLDAANFHIHETNNTQLPLEKQALDQVLECIDNWCNCINQHWTKPLVYIKLKIDSTNNTRPRQYNDYLSIIDYIALEKLMPTHVIEWKIISEKNAFLPSSSSLEHLKKLLIRELYARNE